MERYKKLRLALKLAVSTFLAAFIFYKFPVGDILAVLKNTDYFWFAVAFLLAELIILNQAIRWNYMLIVDKESKPSFKEFLNYTLVGYFFNPVAPGGIGADIYRSVALGKAYKVMKESVASIAVNKILSLIALCLLFWIGFFYVEIPIEAVYFILLFNFCLIMFCVLLFYNPLGNDGKLGRFLEKVKIYGKHKKRIALATLSSVFMQCLGVLMQFALFMSVGIKVPFALLLVIVPVTMFAVTIPVSFGGIGVREWCMLALTSSVVNSEQLLASVLLGYAIVILQAVQGGIFLSNSR